jgi:hypothetical protein
MWNQAPTQRCGVSGHTLRLAWLTLSLALGMAACSDGGSSGSSGGPTSIFSAPDCSGSTALAAGTFTSDVPQWIQDHFKCINAYVSGNNVVIQTKSLPAYTSAYYSTSSALYDSPPNMPTDHIKNPNTTSAQKMTFTLPKTPLTSSSQFTAIYSESTADMGGVAIDGAPSSTPSPPTPTSWPTRGGPWITTTDIRPIPAPTIIMWNPGN